jgi:phosphatidylinositol-3,4,5-trisphosphate 3-phosphatase and dual-specificity protein phosphatase PTEN
MGWLWFIPLFHVSQTFSSTQDTTRFLLTRKEVDFPLGVGSAIVDVEISLEACEEAEAEMVQPLARQTTQESQEPGTSEPSGIAVAVQAVTAGVPEAVKVKQATED